MNELFLICIPYALLACYAFAVNIPLGFLREGYPRFSWQWFFLIHASIPFLIYLRISMHTSAFFIPVTLFLAIVGQLNGGKIRRKIISKSESERIKQIPDLQISKRHPVKDPEILVALLNMGGPKTNEDVANFQKCLFEDPLLIRFPLSFLLQKFFAWILIKVRLKAVKERYMLIGGGSPIYRSTEDQVKALTEELRKRGRNIAVTYSFNYSPPFSTDTVKEAKSAGKSYLLPLSLYPHYSKATTGSNLHYIEKAKQELYPQLQILTPPAYYLHEGYIQAFVDRIHETLKSHESLEDFYLVFSAHGLPQYFLKEGDPYPFQVSQTIAQILAKLGRTTNWVIAYQSAVGPLQWLKPSTDDILESLADRGIRNVLIVPVSFVGDHIETICEIDIEYRHMAKKLGITDYRMSKALECHPGFIKALADSVEAVIDNKNPINQTEFVYSATKG